MSMRSRFSGWPESYGLFAWVSIHSAKCFPGTYCYSQGRQMTCSWHQVIADYSFFDFLRFGWEGVLFLKRPGLAGPPQKHQHFHTNHHQSYLISTSLGQDWTQCLSVPLHTMASGGMTSWAAELKHHREVMGLGSRDFYYHRGFIIHLQQLYSHHHGIG